MFGNNLYNPKEDFQENFPFIISNCRTLYFASLEVYPFCSFNNEILAVLPSTHAYWAMKWLDFR